MKPATFAPLTVFAQDPKRIGARGACAPADEGREEGERRGEERDRLPGQPASRPASVIA